MKTKLFLLLLFLGAILLLPTLTRAQAPLFFDAFLFDNAGQPAANFNLFLQWEVTNGSVDLVGGNVPGAVDQTNGRFVELGGSTGDPGEFATRVALPFLPNTTYNLRFDYKSSDGNLNSARVSIGSQVYQFSTASTELQSFSQDFSFDALTNERIVFQNLDNDNNGVGIDNVVLTQIIAPTAANAEVGGRVTTASGQGIPNVSIRMSDANGNVRFARSSSFGYYSFSDVPTGGTYFFTAGSKTHSFSEQTQVRNVSGDTSDINFTAAN